MTSLDTTNYHEKYMKYKCNYLALKELTVDQDGCEETNNQSTKNILKNIEYAVNKNFEGVDTSQLINNINKRLGSKEDIQKILKNSDKQTLPPHVNKIIEEEVNKDEKLTDAVNKTIDDLGGIDKVKKQIEFIHKTTSFSRDLANKMIFVKNSANQTGGGNESSSIHQPTDIPLWVTIPAAITGTTLVAAQILTTIAFLSGYFLSIRMAYQCNNIIKRSFISKSLHMLGGITTGWFYIMYQTTYYPECINILNEKNI
jgi:hypothetical protein